MKKHGSRSCSASSGKLRGFRPLLPLLFLPPLPLSKGQLWVGCIKAQEWMGSSTALQQTEKGWNRVISMGGTVTEGGMYAVPQSWVINPDLPLFKGQAGQDLRCFNPALGSLGSCFCFDSPGASLSRLNFVPGAEGLTVCSHDAEVSGVALRPAGLLSSH